MTDYIKGQEDLIKQIKEDVSTMIERTTSKDYMFDILDLLKNIKPIERPNK